MANKKKRNTGYTIAVFGAKGILRILIYILVVCSVILLCKTAYSFGYSIYKQEPMSEAPGQAVTVVVPEGSSTMEIGSILEKKGLVESHWMFLIQEWLSEYHGKMQAGTYLLNTAMIPNEIMAVLSGEKVEGFSQEIEEVETVSQEETSEAVSSETQEETVVSPELDTETEGASETGNTTEEIPAETAGE